jgi:hypothetical protein
MPFIQEYFPKRPLRFADIRRRYQSGTSIDCFGGASPEAGAQLSQDAIFIYKNRIKSVKNV